MNQFVREQWPMFEGTHAMRNEMLDKLTDTDLSFSPGGQNMTLGALCREMGEVEQSYLDSLTALTQNFDYRNTEPGIDTDLVKLKAWFQAMDSKMQTTLTAMSDADFERKVDRGSFDPTIEVQMQIYLQALLIFFGKATIFFRAMNKPLPESVQAWIG